MLFRSVRVESIFPDSNATSFNPPHALSPVSTIKPKLKPTHPPSSSLSNFLSRMDADVPWAGGQGGGGFMSNSLSTSLSLPLARYTTRLITGEHHSLLWDCTQPRSEDYDDRHMSDGGGGGGDFSKPIVVLDVIWNLAFVSVSMVVLLSTFQERPSRPLRVWIFGYALQCLLHVGFVCFQFRRRNGNEDRHSSIVKRLESMNTMFSSVWWVFGFCWILAGGQVLMQDSPRLYWLAVVFLAFDVFFMMFCIGMACIFFFALFCCIPLAAIAYAMKIREGASEDDIRLLPRYRFCDASLVRKVDDDKKQALEAAVELGSSSSISDLALHPEDSECCICLSRYVDGAELYILPCNHHFHCGCISRWLRINATCPLCKFNILRGDMLV